MNLVNRLYNSFKSFPENVALSEDNCEITYASLLNESSKVAVYLLERHIVNSFIAIEVDSSTDHIIAMLGILMSGNAYVSVTAENKVFLSVADSLQVKLTIISGTSSSATSVCISDLLKQDLPSYLNEEILRGDKIGPKAAMCAFFTSGSTGKAKVIIHTHQNIFSDTMRQIRSNKISQSDKLDLIFSLSFSASLACIFPALLTGAELCIFKLQKEGLHQLAVFWQQKNITFSTLAVSSFEGVCKIEPSLKHLNSLRFISIGAEPIKDTTIDLFKSRFPAASVLQIAYATTETRTISEIKIYNDGRRTLFAESVGKAVEGKSVHITDPGGNLLPANTVGEIMVVSAFIAADCGWENEESKPGFSAKGERLCYRTGDLGYLDDEGYLFYIGRSAYEYKLNGVKINTATIEQVVEKVENILAAAVIICQSKNGEQKLVCFFTCTSETNCSTNNFKEQEEAIRMNISRVLPPSHHPQFYIQLDQMPLTHSGKIDRKTLEKVDPIAHCDKSNNSTNKNPGKEDSSIATSIIVETFKNVLKTTEIDENSDFFYNGGDSLSGLVCLAKIESALNVKLKAFALVSHPTPKRLSKYISTNQGGTNNFIETKALNSYLKERKNLYLLHHLPDHVHDPLIQGKLSTHFNLVMCYYDLRHIHESNNAANLLLQELVEIIGEHEDPIVMGYSISGFLAHQLACTIPNITCAMIDTYNYFEMERYRPDNSLRSKIKNICWQVLQNKDFAFPWHLLYSKYEWIFVLKKQGWHDQKFFNGVDYLIKNLKNKTALHNCIYFQASRANQDNGSSWKSYVDGDFHYRSLKATHQTIIKDHANEISNYIIKKSV